MTSNIAVASSNIMDGQAIGNNSMSARNTLQESIRLGSSQSGWVLRGSTTTTAPCSRTRNAGQGRPNLVRREYNEAISSSSSSEEDELSVSEEEWDEQYEEELSEEEDDYFDEWEKPPATRFILDQESTKNFIERNSRCKDCNGPVELKADHLSRIEPCYLLQR